MREMWTDGQTREERIPSKKFFECERATLEGTLAATRVCLQVAKKGVANANEDEKRRLVKMSALCNVFGLRPLT